MAPARKARSKAPRCSFPDCNKQVQTRRLCKAHGGGVRCRGPDCTKLAQSRGLCVAHGGGCRCTASGCPKLAQSRGLCLSHGGGQRCCEPGCQKFVQLNRRCKAHAKDLMSNADARPPAATVALQAEPKTSGSKFSIAFIVNPLDSPVLPPPNRRR